MITFEAAKKLPVLRNGSKRPEVKLLKSLLRSQGDWGGTDSDDFGPKLEAAVRYFQTTHIGRLGAYLKGDGEVGPETWWVLHNPKADPKTTPVAPSTEKRTEDHIPAFDHRYGRLPVKRNQFLRAAFDELALAPKEIPDGSNWGGQVTKYVKPFGTPAPWCALFVCWLFKKVTGRNPENKLHAHVQTGILAAMSLGRFYKVGTRIPVPGDLAVWKYAKGAGHVAVVVAATRDGKKFNTIAGNESNKVRLGTRTVANEPQLAGFIDLFKDGARQDMTFELLKEEDTEKLTEAGTR